MTPIPKAPRTGKGNAVVDHPAKMVVPQAIDAHQHGPRAMDAALPLPFQKARALPAPEILPPKVQQRLHRAADLVANLKPIQRWENIEGMVTYRSSVTERSSEQPSAAVLASAPEQQTIVTTTTMSEENEPDISHSKHVSERNPKDPSPMIQHDMGPQQQQQIRSETPSHKPRDMSTTTLDGQRADDHTDAHTKANPSVSPQPASHCEQLVEVSRDTIDSGHQVRCTGHDQRQASCSQTGSSPPPVVNTAPPTRAIDEQQRSPLEMPKSLSSPPQTQSSATAEQNMADEVVPLQVLQSRTAESSNSQLSTQEPLQLVLKARRNDLTQSERQYVQSLASTFGGHHRFDFVSEKAKHVYRCPLPNCKNP